MHLSLACTLSCLLAVATSWTLDYPEAKQDPANAANFQYGRQGEIKGLVLHGTAGSNTVEWFKNPEA
ncbi:unnamed protein product [Didymodactylos carnosus]|uniref:Uncharacterized protein n=1 Tax=Didymodactylos carnosus TaxID=1234261 RepID=A0A814ZL63_9BILA|nr:unnamed protein product [Didymodactylos carnosus]CAF1568832.1 unnamed protein product [Didymodactylos carnosus]CAF4011022.1 unnamed protein product [Didymodactylos carnosus]CAF4362546.1 unnamed protein product [Didymodactylos carnosus]